MHIPKQLQHYLLNMKYTIDDEGMSSANVYKFSNDKQTLFLKTDKSDRGIVREKQMYSWLKDKLPLPKVIAQCSDNGIDYLLISKADGVMAQDKKYINNPELLIRLVADAIYMLWNVDITNCPFDSTIEAKLLQAKELIENGNVESIERNKYTFDLDTPTAIYQYLEKNKLKEDYVFVHGDLCPNNFFFDGEKVSCFIDLGRAGKGDRWQDIALCIRELEEIIDEKYINKLFELLGITPNYEKIKYYILLDELF